MNDILQFEQVTLGEGKAVEELSALASAIVKEHYDPILGAEQNDYMIQKFQSVAAIEEQLGNGYQYYFVCLEPDRHIGFMGMYQRGSEWYISKLYLHRDFRGRGYARQMVDFAISLAKKAGSEIITLNVNKYNNAVAIYEKLGFERIRDEVNEIGHGYVMDDYVYALSLRDELKWAVLGTGVIANEMAAALQKMGKGLYAVGNRTHEKAVAFAEKYHVQKVYGQIDEMFTDPEVDIIYITTPHNTHYEFMKKALEHGKHIFVEKSITLNSRELDEMTALARERNLVLAEAMTVWHMPVYKKLWKMVAEGKLGKVQMITLNFGSFKEYDMKNRFFNMDLAGGALLDIGVYALSIVRSFMSEAPDQILSQMKPSPTGSDEQASILLMNPAGEMAAVSLTMHSKQPKRAMISCEKGYIEIMEYPRADRAVIVDAETGKSQEIMAGSTEDALFYEMKDMERAVRYGKTEEMQLSYTKDVMDIMTGLRKEWGLRYPEERWDS